MQADLNLCGAHMTKGTFSNVRLVLIFQMTTTTQDIETGIIRGPKRNFLYLIFSAVFLEAFILTFLAEWGDRSQIATIILAAREVSSIAV